MRFGMANVRPPFARVVSLWNAALRRLGRRGYQTARLRRDGPFCAAETSRPIPAVRPAAGRINLDIAATPAE